MGLPGKGVSQKMMIPHSKYGSWAQPISSQNHLDGIVLERYYRICANYSSLLTHSFINIALQKYKLIDSDIVKHIFIHMNMYMFIYFYIYTYVYIHIHKNIYIYLYMYMYMYMYVYMYMCIYTHVYIHMYNKCANTWITDILYIYVCVIALWKCNLQTMDMLNIYHICLPQICFLVVQ